jgi:hypothetical protein
MKTSPRFLLLTALVAAPAFVLAPSATFATSQTTTLSLPKNASPWNEIAPRFDALLSALAKEQEVGLDVSGTHGEVEVFAWRGPSYKAGRTSFVQMSLNGELAKAGYTVRSIDSNRLRHVNPSAHFSSQDDSPFQPDIWKLPAYFVAENTAKGHALVGALLESDNALALGMLPVSLKAVTSTSLPRVASGAFLVKDANDAMKGIAPPRVSFTPMSRKPRTAHGQIKDSTGRPIAGATVHAESGAFGGFRTLHRARTNAQGIYQIPLPTGVCQVTAAFATIAYGGKNYGLPLHPVTNLKQFDSARGNVENFVLRTWGPTGPQTANDADNHKLYYGGSVRLVWMSEIAEGGTFEVTLTPSGALLGGGAGKTLVFRIPNKNYGANLNDIPLGRYTIKVSLLDDGDRAPVRLEPYGPSTTPKEMLPIAFEPVSATIPDFGYSPVRQTTIMLRP